MVARAEQASGQELAGREGGVASIAVGLGLLLLVFTVAYFPSLKWMAGEWSSSSGALSHGYLVAGISLFLFVRAIFQVDAAEVRPCWWFAVVVAGLSLVWLLGYAATVVAVQTVVLPALFLGVAVLMMGWSASRHFVFPILYFGFSLPAWEHLQFVFQDITVLAVGILIRIADVPAVVEGNYVQIPQGLFRIAGGCSGLNFVVAGLSLSALYSYLFYNRSRQIALLTVLTLSIAMVGNWVRVFVIIWIGYTSDMQSPMVDDHLTFGWLIFAGLLVPVFFVARKLEDTQPSDVPEAVGGQRSGLPKMAWLAGVSGILLMSVGPAWARFYIEQGITGETMEVRFEPVQGGWSGPHESSWGWRPKFTGPHGEALSEFRHGDNVVLAYENIYLGQAQDRELIYFNNDIRGSWRVPEHLSSDLGVVAVATDTKYSQEIATSYLGDWLIWYRYRHGTRWDTDPAAAKLSQALETLAGRPDAGVVAFAALCATDCSDAAALLERFVTDAGLSASYKQLMGAK